MGTTVCRVAVTGFRLLTSSGSAASARVFTDFGQRLLEVDPGSGQMPLPGIASLARLHHKVIAVNRNANRHQFDGACVALLRFPSRRSRSSHLAPSLPIAIHGHPALFQSASAWLD